MILQRLSIINYKNIAEATLDFSPKINCFIGQNGAGKTNVLDAIYFLSFCRSAQTALDSQVIRHDQPFFVLEGEYYSEELRVKSEESFSEELRVKSEESLSEELRVKSEEFATATDNGKTDAEANSSLFTLHSSLSIYCGMKRGTKKHFKRDKKEYKRLSEHIGLIPLVHVSPGDTLLIEGGSEERRKLMDMVISQLERPYIESLNRYNKVLLQRNAMLKDEDQEPDPEVLDILEEQMAAEGEYIYERRRAFVDKLVPLFQEFYNRISGGHEVVSLSYSSHCQRGPLLEVIRRDRMKDRAVGYSLHGIHRDDLEFLLDGHPMRREGSQGQQKTFVISLKLAQFAFLKRTNAQTTPLLLLDDIFDKLDATRVEQIVSLVSEEAFGQIFITDTNRDHLNQILASSSPDYKIFHVNNGCINV